MDGPALIHQAWLLCIVWLWAYRRFFQTVAPRSAEFEAFCEEGPILAALAVQAGAEAAIAATLTASVGKRSEVIATLGVWPWTHHALRVRISSAPGLVELRLTGCRVLRSHEAKLPTLTDALHATVEQHADTVSDSWLYPKACADGRGRTAEPAGWRLAARNVAKHPCEPRDTPAEWLSLNSFNETDREFASPSLASGAGATTLLSA